MFCFKGLSTQWLDLLGVEQGRWWGLVPGPFPGIWTGFLESIPYDWIPCLALIRGEGLDSVSILYARVCWLTNEGHIPSEEWGGGDRKGRLGLVCKMKTFLVKNLSSCVWQGGGSRTRIPLSWTVGQMTSLTLQILHPRLFLPRLLRGPVVFEELSGGIEGDTGHLSSSKCAGQASASFKLIVSQRKLWVLIVTCVNSAGDSSLEI